MPYHHDLYSTESSCYEEQNVPWRLQWLHTSLSLCTHVTDMMAFLSLTPDMELDAYSQNTTQLLVSVGCFWFNILLNDSL